MDNANSQSTPIILGSLRYGKINIGNITSTGTENTTNTNANGADAESVEQLKKNWK